LRTFTAITGQRTALVLLGLELALSVLKHAVREFRR
jgi:hypothetical protein